MKGDRHSSALSVLGVYRRTFEGGLAKIRPLFLLAALVFIPLGLVEVASHRISAEPGGATSAALVAAAVSAITLVGEVFFSGAVAALFCGPAGRSTGEIARSIPYGRLIVVDLLFAAGLVVTLLLVVAPGVAFFAYFALAAPVVEIEDQDVRAAFRRSRRLVAGHFWRVLAVLGPVYLVGDAVIGGVESAAYQLFGDSFFAAWIGASSSYMLVSPVFAVAAVLLALELIRIRAPGPEEPVSPARVPAA